MGNVTEAAGAQGGGAEHRSVRVLEDFKADVKIRSLDHV